MTLYIGNRKAVHTVRVGEIRNQDKTITEKGTFTADPGYTGLGTVVVNVESLFGELHFGTLDPNGVYTDAYSSTYTGNVSFDNVAQITSERAFYRFLSRGDSEPLQCREIIGSIIFPDLVSVSAQEAFYQFTYNQPSITSISFPALTSITGSYSFVVLTNTQGIDVNFGGLTSTYALDSFNNLSSMFDSCEEGTAHFPSNLSSIIPDDPGILGGYNTTIAFDLPATT